MVSLWFWTQDLLRLQWRVQEEDNVTSLKMSRPNTFTWKAVSVKKYFHCIFRSLQSSFSLSRYSFIGHGFFFLNITFQSAFLVYFCSLCNRRFSYSQIICSYSLFSVYHLLQCNLLFPSSLSYIPSLLIPLSCIVSLPRVHCEMMASSHFPPILTKCSKITATPRTEFLPSDVVFPWELGYP